MDVNITYERDDDFRELLKEKIKEYNNSISFYHKISRSEDYVKYVNLEIKGDNFIAGLSARIYWKCLEVDDLFIDQEFKRKGYGTKLVKTIIEIALEKQLNFIWLKTFSFQARDFYEKLGFTVVGVLEDYPPGESLFTMRLDL